MKNTCMPYVPWEIRDNKRSWVNRSLSNVRSCGPNHHNLCASGVSFDRVDHFIQSHVCLFTSGNYKRARQLCRT